MDTLPHSDTTPNPTILDPVFATLRLLGFCRADSEFRFLSVEPLFRRHRVTSQTVGYDYVINALPPATIVIVRDILRSLPPDNPYYTLTNELIFWTSESEQRRLQQLLTL